LVGVIRVTFRILDSDVVRFGVDLFVSSGSFYVAIKSRMLNRYRKVKWLVVEH